MVPFESVFRGDSRSAIHYLIGLSDRPQIADLSAQPGLASYPRTSSKWVVCGTVRKAFLSQIQRYYVCSVKRSGSLGKCESKLGQLEPWVFKNAPNSMYVVSIESDGLCAPESVVGFYFQQLVLEESAILS